MNQDKSVHIQSRLRELEEERKQLLHELDRIQSDSLDKHELPPQLGIPALEFSPSSADEKSALFLKLFRCRDDVYPKLWENKSKGTKGYAPACDNEWVSGICEKPKIKCSACTKQAFLKLDATAAMAHLRGLVTIGTYSIDKNDNCIFLACDFDGDNWQDDAKTYRNVSRTYGIDVAIERSRSGVGAHAWIFFSEPVPARLARALGALIISKCSEFRHQLSLESFDRFFPNQDYLPVGGFGNLIALPLQKLPRESGNSCFLDEDFNVYENQWEYLSQVNRISLLELQSILNKHLPDRPSKIAGEVFEDLSLIRDQCLLEASSDTDQNNYNCLLNGIYEVTFGSQLHIPLAGLPGKLVTKLKGTASFANPEFYKLQRMRRHTYPEPRFIFSGEINHAELLLPRGTIEKVIKILTNAGANVIIRDERLSKRKIKVAFKGALTKEQTKAIKVIKSFDCGVLVAPPGAGKTVIGCALIAERKTSTLILVHRQPIMDQWKERIQEFLEVDPKNIGIFGGSKKKRSGKIDIGMLQSLAKTENMEEIANSYSQIIIDECHHIPASSFEGVMKQIPARYIVGLTATPRRKDGLEKILFQQCGPIRYEMDYVEDGQLTKETIIKETGFRIPSELGNQPPYHLLIEALISDENRNALIARDAIAALKESRFPLLLTDRIDQLDCLDRLIKQQSLKDPELSNIKIVKLYGNLSAKNRGVILNEVTDSRSAKQPTLIIATSSLIGEGFDLPSLDTLILSMPLSFEGRMIQYAGRLHRIVEGKSNVVIYDYMDSFSAIFLKMFRNRVKAYKKMGYKIRRPDVVTEIGTFSSGDLHCGV